MPTQKGSTPTRIFLLLLFVAACVVASWLYHDHKSARNEPGDAPLAEETTGPLSEPTPGERLTQIFGQWHSKPELAGAAVGFCLLDENGTVLFASPMASVAMCPASSLKTVTSGAALNLLGPEYRFETVLAATSLPDGSGAVEGDLILVGSGDPTLSQEDLEKLATEAATGGLKSVTGRLLADTSIFPENPTNDFWNWGDIGNAYGAGAYGINVDHNTLTISFEPGPDIGAPAGVLNAGPAPKDVQWLNKVTTGPEHSGDNVVVYSEPYGRKITLRGTVPKGESGFTVRGAIPDPPAFALEVLRTKLEAASIQFGDQPGPFAGERKIIAKHLSKPLPEIIDHLHRVSDNLETQCLFLTMGRRANSAPHEVVRRFWEEAGVQFAGLRLLDGSGLARANTIRPLDLAGVDSAARRTPHGARFVESLTSYANGTIRAKRGAMSGVRTEVGFLRTASGRDLTYAVMGNALGRNVDFWGAKQELLDAVRDIGF